MSLQVRRRSARTTRVLSVARLIDDQVRLCAHDAAIRYAVVRENDVDRRDTFGLVGFLIAVTRSIGLCATTFRGMTPRDSALTVDRCGLNRGAAAIGSM
jgi:hypothetical protein